MNSKNVLRGLILTLTICTPLLFSSKALQKGQIIKQFFSYSISESLASRPWDWLSTTLPCTPVRTWVEELPLFHFLAGLYLTLFPDQSTLVPLIAYALLIFSIFLFSREWGPGVTAVTRWCITVSVGMCPIFLRYSFQHIPDLLATSFLCLGVFAIWKKNQKIAILLFALSVTVKALTVFALLPVLLWDVFVRSRLKFKAGMLKIFFITGLSVLPFLGWLLLIWYLEIPNPFDFQSFVENRHSGDLGLLFTSHFWMRGITWVGIKGVGLILFIFGGIRFWKLLRQRSSWTHLEGIFFFWTAGVLPYWILVRQGNFVHDYYTLPFALPLAFLGAIEIVLLKKSVTLKRCYLSYTLLLLNTTIGVLSIASMREVPISKNQSRPMFCNLEK